MTFPAALVAGAVGCDPRRMGTRLRPLLEKYGNDPRLTVILFTLDETSYARELAPLAQTLKEADIAPSQETAALLERLFQTIQQSAHSALRALVEGDERAAQTVIASRDAILELTSDLYRQQAARLTQDDSDRLLKHRVQLEILDKLRRIYSVAEHMAISVLPRRSPRSRVAGVR